MIVAVSNKLTLMQADLMVANTSVCLSLHNGCSYLADASSQP